MARNTLLRDRASLKLDPAISEDDWRSSIYYRPGLEYKPRMTTIWARAIAENYDRERRNAVRLESMSGSSKAGYFLGALGGGVFDPINLIPFGIGATSVKSLGGAIRAGAATNVAAEIAITPMKLASDRTLQRDVDLDDYMIDLGFAATLGGIFGGAGHALGSATRALRIRHRLTPDAQASLDQVMAPPEGVDTPNLDVPEVRPEGIRETVQDRPNVPEGANQAPVDLDPPQPRPRLVLDDGTEVGPVQGDTAVGRTFDRNQTPRVTFDQIGPQPAPGRFDAPPQVQPVERIGASIRPIILESESVNGMLDVQSGAFHSARRTVDGTTTTRKLPDIAEAEFGTSFTGAIEAGTAVSLAKRKDRVTITGNPDSLSRLADTIEDFIRNDELSVEVVVQTPKGKKTLRLDENGDPEVQQLSEFLDLNREAASAGPRREFVVESEGQAVEASDLILEGVGRFERTRIRIGDDVHDFDDFEALRVFLYGLGNRNRMANVHDVAAKLQTGDATPAEINAALESPEIDYADDAARVLEETQRAQFEAAQARVGTEAAEVTTAREILGDKYVEDEDGLAGLYADADTSRPEVKSILDERDQTVERLKTSRKALRDVFACMFGGK
ncbi:hypothetical protein [Pacificispira sp.]|uniref:hypothetical protein n=1 Tax=Pacificispira sp. TaxID=2888761 RepID=UPI003BAC4F61